jgi:hypothetical protein
VSLLLLFAGAPQGGSGTPPEDPAVSGQPVMIRTQHVTFGAGSRDRPNSFNFRLLARWVWRQVVFMLRPVWLRQGV